VTNGASVDVDGGDRLASTLHNAADDVAELDDAKRDAGRIVEERARKGAPRDTGALVSSIASTVEDADVLIASSLPVYPGVQEYGSTHTPAHPYMRPALEASTTQIVDLFEDDVRKAIDQVKGA